MFKQSFNYSQFKPRKSKTKQMQYKDAIRRKKQEILIPSQVVNKNDSDKDLPLIPSAQLLGGSAFTLPLRLSSPSQLGLINKLYSGRDQGISEVPVLVSGPTLGSNALIGEEEGEGEGEASGVIDYRDNQLIDKLLQDNPYFNC